MLFRSIAPLQVAIGAGTSFSGYVDLVHRRAWRIDGGKEVEIPIPADLAAEVATRRDQLLEAASEADDDVLTKYLVARHLLFSDKIEVVEGFFYLTHVRNPGAAFGLFATAPATWRLGFFIGISLLALGIVVSFFRKLAPGEIGRAHV